MPIYLKSAINYKSDSGKNMKNQKWLSITMMILIEKQKDGLGLKFKKKRNQASWIFQLKDNNICKQSLRLLALQMLKHKRGKKEKMADKPE